MGVTQDFNHMCWYILLFLQSPSSKYYFYSKHHMSIKVKATYICTFCKDLTAPASSPQTKKMLVKFMAKFQTYTYLTR